MLQHRFVAVAALAVTCSLRAAPAEVLDYRIEPGDTFIGVTERLLRPGTRWQQLQRANPGLQPLRLPPGRTLRIPTHLLQETAEMAEVMHAHGSVTLERAGAPPVALTGGERLRRGDRVRTGAQSSSTLRFADGARVLVRPLSDLTIDKTVRWGPGGPVQTELGLDAGSADSLVPPAAGPAQPPRFRIRTPVANLGVRGTEFRTSAERDRTRLEVLQGTVALRPGATAAGASASGGERRARPAADLPVAAGFGAIASPQQATPLQPLLGPPDLTPTASRLERMPVSLGWPALAGASSYRAQVFDAAGTEVLRLDGRFDQPQARWPDDLPDGAYELRVRGVAAGGLEGRDARHPFTLKARPEPPLLNMPAADARLASPSIEFSWTRNPQAARYRLQVADDAAFGTPRIDRDDLSATGAGLELPEGTHWWRLASVRADGDQGPWGDAQRVTRVPQPPPPPPEPPESTDSGMKLRWGAGAPGTRYQVQVSRDPGFATVLHDERVEQPSWLLPKPEPGRYLVRVRSIDAEGFEGPFGTPQEIEVQRSLWWLMLLPLVLLL